MTRSLPVSDRSAATGARPDCPMHRGAAHPSVLVIAAPSASWSTAEGTAVLIYRSQRISCLPVPAVPRAGDLSRGAGATRRLSGRTYRAPDRSRFPTASAQRSHTA
jgi:hypothetical protein